MENRVPGNAEILHKVEALAAVVDAHVAEEKPIIRKAEPILDALGAEEDVRARITFINAWMERERDNKKLRMAIIEKTLIGAIWALTVYVFIAVGNDLKEIIHTWSRIK